MLKQKLRETTFQTDQQVGKGHLMRLAWCAQYPRKVDGNLARKVSLTV
jgi:hypothetical protein